MIRRRSSSLAPLHFTLLALLAVAVGCSAEPEPTRDAGPHDARPDVRDATGPMDVVSDRPADVGRPDVVDVTSPDAAIVCAEAVECPIDRPFCDGATNTCVACLTQPSDTCPAGQYCDPTGRRCTAGCRSDGDCAAGGATIHCDTTRHACVGCNADSDCTPGSLCSSGTCVAGCNATHGCAVGATCCTGTCQQLDADPANCGTCGTVCTAGQTCCGGHCASTATDGSNCGRCGRSCALGHAQPVCASGTCATTHCDTGFADCDHDATNGCEAATTTDTANCGVCGHACASGPSSMATCSGGTCGLTCTGGSADCDHQSANGCESALNTDTANCGSCGHACTGGPNAAPTCAMGLCGTRCTTGYGDCDGAAANGCETALTTTPTACGACGNVCSVPNAVASCLGGSCGIAACISGYGNCDGSLANGCETATTTNSNCGTCGRACGAGTVCSMGTCSSVCASPTSYCAGACVDFTSDATNCGSCGHACATVPNAAPRCSSGACGFTCASGFGDCDGIASNGCETDLRTSVGNCGTCTHVCATPGNGTATCAGGACGLGMCNPNFADCNGSVADGCETDLRTTLTNCGACGNACPPRNNASAACASSTCGLGACSTGFGNCNGDPVDGCEANLNTSNANCGSCGHTCGVGTACSAGTCSSVCGAGLTFCAASGTCVNVQTDNANCGTCGHACAAGTGCSTGVCVALPPANDHCAAATVIDLSTQSQTLASTTVNASQDLAAPCVTASFSGPDVFYRFTLAQPELVYADTVGATWDTILYFATSCATAMPVSASTTGLIECDDDLGVAGCTTGLQSQVTAYLGAGTYYLVLAGYNGATGTASVHFQHMPTGNNGSTAATPPAPRLLPAGTSTQSGTTSGTGRITAGSEGLAACYFYDGTSEGAGGAGPEQTYFWRSCPEYAGGTFSASTCNATTQFDTLIYVANAGSTSGNDCGDDIANCGSNALASSIPHATGPTVTVPAGARLHLFVVDGYSSSESGPYQVSVTRP